MELTALTSVDFDKLTITSIEEVYAFSRSNDKLLFCFDQVKEGELSGDNEVVYQEGKLGQRLGSFKRNKTAKFTCKNGYVLMSALNSQLGGTIKTASANDKMTIRRVEYLTVGATSGTANLTLTTSDTPVSGQPKYIYLLNEDKSVSEEFWGFANGETAADFTVAGKVITLPTSTSAHPYAPIATDVFLVVYDTEVSVAKRVMNEGDKFAETVKLLINMIGTDPCTDTDYLIQGVMPRADISGTFAISIGSDPAVHDFEAEASADPCSTNKGLFSLTMA